MTAAEKDLINMLEKAKQELLSSSQFDAASGRWERAQAKMQWAREIDEISVGLKQNGDFRAPVVAASISPNPTPPKLPYHYVRGNKLGKVGAGRRDGTTYEHRVPMKDYDVILREVIALVRERKVFDTADLLRRCDVPKHEPLIILAVLEEARLLMNVRRGMWAVADAETFETKAQEVWSALPRH